MARRSIFAAVAIALAWSASAQAATAPSTPQRASAAWVSPAVLQWTPGADPLNVSQTIYRAPGACTTPLAAGAAVRVYPDNTTSQHFAVPGDGTFCFSILATDTLGATASSGGVTVRIDTTAPTTTVAVSNQAAGGVVSGTVTVSRSSADAGSGIAASVRHVGAVGACAAGPVLRTATWDTTAYPDGIYDVCNVATDAAGLSTTATVRITVANTVVSPDPTPLTPSAVAPASPVPGADAPAGAVIQAEAADKVAPAAPTRIAVSLPRAKDSSALVVVAVRWANPDARDLDRVVVVLNPNRAPRGVTDGAVVYRGLRTSATFKLRPGKTGHLALFAYDRSGNVSQPARRVVSLASLIPLRPLTGSVVRSAPLLTWKAKEGSAYYNVQVFRDGKRILVEWPSQASYRLPAYLLTPGTYTWLVWPAVKRKGATPAFADLIGRATFVYKL
jgi:hypothetical protein